LRRTLVRILLAAVLLAVLLIALVILLDRFGTQPQPFQYILH
jgi:hypothetical protein